MPGIDKECKFLIARSPSEFDFAFTLVGEVISELRSVVNQLQLTELMAVVAKQSDFHFWALIHHDDLRLSRPEHVNLMHYPSGAVHRIISECCYRRDPIVRGCLYSGGAFVWSQLNRVMDLDRFDQAMFELGAKEGLNEGITVPYMISGECPGSCTFAGMRHPEKAEKLIGLAQIIGVFVWIGVQKGPR